MDIGNQQRVIIVETEPSEQRDPEAEPAQIIDAPAVGSTEVQAAASWPLPLDLDGVPVS